MCKGILTPQRGPTIVGIPFVPVLTSSVLQWRPPVREHCLTKSTPPRAFLTSLPSLSDAISESFRRRFRAFPMSQPWTSENYQNLDEFCLIVSVHLLHLCYCRDRAMCPHCHRISSSAAIVINNSRKLIFFFYQSSILKR